MLINKISKRTRNVLIRTLESLLCTQTRCQKYIISFNHYNIFRGRFYYLYYTDKEMECQSLLALHRNKSPVRGTPAI